MCKYNHVVDQGEWGFVFVCVCSCFNSELSVAGIALPEQKNKGNNSEYPSPLTQFLDPLNSVRGMAEYKKESLCP